MPDIRQIAQDPDFRKLPVEEQRKAFSEYDSDFASLPTTEQDKGISELTKATTDSAKKLSAAISGEPGVMDILKKRAGEAYQGIKAPFDNTTAYNAVGAIAKPAMAAGGAINDLIGLAIPESVKKLGKELIEPVAQQPAVKYLMEKGGELLRNNPQLAKAVSGIADASGLIMAPGIGRGLKAIAPAVKEAGNIVADVGRVSGRAAAPTAEKLANLIKPKPDPAEALKQILQGKTKDIPKGEKALSAVDTTGVKTYGDLDQRLDSHVKTYAKQVDAELMKDPEPHPLSELITKTKTEGGATVTQNHVEDALGQLKELYEKINDPVRAKEIQELTATAQKTGLTKKQVNDLARTYGNEFGDKAFSKVTRDPLTSVNGQAYENTRKGLKETARQGMGPEAKELDATLSSIINTRELIQKNVEAVNKLRAKVDPRSPLEKVGRMAVKAADMLSGGLVRGVVGGLLPRGVGNKVFNALDLEEKLTRNLKIVNDALKQSESGATIDLSSKTGKVIQGIINGGDTDLSSYLKMPNERLPVDYRGSNDLPTLQKSLDKVSKQIVSLEQTTPKVTDIQSVQKALQAKGVPFMRQVNESTKGYEDRIIQQYQRSIGGEVPTAAGAEPPALKELRDLQTRLQKMVGGENAVPSSLKRNPDAQSVAGTGTEGGRIDPGASGRGSGGVTPALAEKARKQGVMVPDETLRKEAAGTVAQEAPVEAKGIDPHSPQANMERETVSKKKRMIEGGEPEPRAEGGPVQAGKQYLVGEQGVELLNQNGKVQQIGQNGPQVIIPKSSGDVISNDQAAMEAYFKASPWYGEFVQNYGEEPDFNSKDYDYMAAFKAGMKPSRDPYDIGPNPVTGIPAPEGGRYHWASKTPEGQWLKNPETHPTAWMQIFMEQTGINPESLGLKTKEQGDQYINQMRLQKLNKLLKGAAQ